jgi:hypothetical protein
VSNRRKPLIRLSALIILLGATSVLLIPTLLRQTKITKDFEFVISLERTACFGHCPIYKVTLDSDGKVTYYGEMFVAVEGTQYSTLDQKNLHSLVREFEGIDFFSLEDQYTDMGATDLPSAITTLLVDGKMKQVIHYHGDPNAPKKLAALEDKIDELINTAQWTEVTVP